MLIRRKHRLMPVRVPQMITNYIRQRAEFAALESEAHDGKTRLDRELVPWFVKAFEDSGRGEERSIQVQYPDGTLIRSTLVVPQGQVLDEDKLRQLVGETEWAKLTSTVTTTYLDQDKLARAVAFGQIDKTLVDACTSDNNGTPYVRHTVKTGTPRVG